MSDLDDAIRKHMTRIIVEENRPFCYLDFLKFEVEHKEYHTSHGTFRNKVVFYGFYIPP